MPRLASYFKKGLVEAGCDEAGRGCLAGPVYAACVILPPGYKNSKIDDSKKLSLSKRHELRTIIEKDALAFGVGSLSNEEIDEHNILKSSFMAMHRAIDQLKINPELLLIDGNRFIPYRDIQHECIVKGDAKFLSIAAASILAKTYRDEAMSKMHEEYPNYGWIKNMGYPTKFHREAILQHGVSPYHRKSFNLFPRQLKLSLD